MAFEGIFLLCTYLAIMYGVPVADFFLLIVCMVMLDLYVCHSSSAVGHLCVADIFVQGPMPIT